MFFGSVADNVLRQTDVPVLAVPDGVSRRELRSWPGGRILCAVEFGSRDRDDVLKAGHVARIFGTDLTLIHVVAPTAGPRWLTRGLRQHDRTSLKAARERLDELAVSVRSAVDVRVDSRALLGQPAEEIAAAATDIGASLIVLTLRPGHGLFGTRQGTVTYQVLCGARRPVLAFQQPSSGGRHV
jgi:nucleotide-binding universal stress UspA family protein